MDIQSIKDNIIPNSAVKIKAALIDLFDYFSAKEQAVNAALIYYYHTKLL